MTDSECNSCFNSDSDACCPTAQYANGVAYCPKLALLPTMYDCVAGNSVSQGPGHNSTKFCTAQYGTYFWVTVGGVAGGVALIIALSIWLAVVMRKRRNARSALSKDDYDADALDSSLDDTTLSDSATVGIRSTGGGRRFNGNKLSL